MMFMTMMMTMNMTLTTPTSTMLMFTLVRLTPAARALRPSAKALPLACLLATNAPRAASAASPPAESLLRLLLLLPTTMTPTSTLQAGAAPCLSWTTQTTVYLLCLCSCPL